MNFEDIIAEIFKNKNLIEHPPVLIDIGASGELQPDWKLIAKYSIVIGFDADSRDFNQAAKHPDYKKLILINKIVLDSNLDKTPFYLTRSPYCSSVLEPDLSSLDNWMFKELFEVEKRIELPAVNLTRILSENGLNRIDWFKTDSQGTDLRLFRSLDKTLQNKVLIAEFEPGFIDAYKGEDKITHLLDYMEKQPFWLSDCIVKGTQKISTNTLKKYNINKEEITARTSACWAEFCYFNTLSAKFSERELLLAWVFAGIKEQHGFALDILSALENNTDALLYRKMVDFSKNQLIKGSASGNKGLKSKIKNKLIAIVNKM